MVGAKYANYDASGNATCLVRNTTNGGVGQAFDKEINWAYLQFKWQALSA